jgi:hypothetical protein
MRPDVRARLDAAIARKNAERGRSLTAREKLDNLARWLWPDASAGEAQRAETVQQGSVHEHATGEAGDAQC